MNALVKPQDRGQGAIRPTRQRPVSTSTLGISVPLLQPSSFGFDSSFGLRHSSFPFRLTVVEIPWTSI